MNYAKKMHRRVIEDAKRSPYVLRQHALTLAHEADARIAELEAENKRLREGEDADLTTAYMVGAEKAKDRIAELEAALTDYINETGVGSTLLPDVVPPESGTLVDKLKAAEDQRDRVIALAERWGKDHREPGETELRRAEMRGYGKAKTEMRAAVHDARARAAALEAENAGLRAALTAKTDGASSSPLEMIQAMIPVQNEIEANRYGDGLSFGRATEQYRILADNFVRQGYAARIVAAALSQNSGEAVLRYIRATEAALKEIRASVRDAKCPSDLDHKDIASIHESLGEIEDAGAQLPQHIKEAL